jgi:hypothetical protein
VNDIRNGTIPGASKLGRQHGLQTGVTINYYRRAGEIDTGSFEFDEPTEAEIERRRRLADGSHAPRRGESVRSRAWFDRVGDHPPGVGGELYPVEAELQLADDRMVDALFTLVVEANFVGCPVSAELLASS